MEKIMVDLDLVERFRWNPENGAILKAARERRKFSRAVFSSLLSARLEYSPAGLGQSTKYIERLESGELRTVSNASLSAIASLLDVAIEDLLLQGYVVKIVYKKPVDIST